MRRRGNQHQLGGLLMLLLFGVFAACVLILLLTGARAYRRLTQRDQAAFDRRTCVQYLATRVRQGDVAGGVSVRPFGEGNALALPAGEGYVTWVYWHDGWLMELYTLEDSGLSPEDGARIMPLAGLSLSLKDGLLTAELADGAGETDTLLLSLLLMEQMVMLLVFALAAALCLQAFVKSDAVSRRSGDRDRAVVLCQSAAEAIRHTGDVEEGLELACGTPPKERDGFGCFVNYDGDWTPLPDDGRVRESSYTLRAAEVDSGVDGLGKAAVEAFAWEAGEMKSLFAIEIAWQEGDGDGR